VGTPYTYTLHPTPYTHQRSKSAVGNCGEPAEPGWRRSSNLQEATPMRRCQPWWQSSSLTPRLQPQSRTMKSKAPIHPFSRAGRKRWIGWRQTPGTHAGPSRSRTGAGRSGVAQRRPLPPINTGGRGADCPFTTLAQQGGGEPPAAIPCGPHLTAGTQRTSCGPEVPLPSRGSEIPGPHQ